MLSHNGLPGCCGANVLHHFNNVPGTYKKWTVDLLAKMLDKKQTYEDGKPMLQPLVFFTHSDAQDTKLLSPKTFADWLRSRGERIYETRPYLHNRHKSKIIGYIWHPSTKFRDEYTNACK